MARVPEHEAIVRSYARPPEWRMNPVTGEWVIVAPERSSRPMLLGAASRESGLNEPCPFCAGRESQTPPEIQAFRSAGSQANAPDWRVRTLPNAFPAVKPLGEPTTTSDGFFYLSNATGRHELIIECPQHEANLTHLSVEQIREVVQMWRERMLDASRDPGLRYAQLFKNHGSRAGASVVHAHSQIIATPLVPRTVYDELDFAASFYQKNDVCCYCDLLRRERLDGSRWVDESPDFVAIAAYAGRQPFETWIVPEKHCSQFELISPKEADELGNMLWTVLRKLDAVLEGPPYNLIFHSAPFHQAPLRHYHWHVEVVPRITQLAGFEWGSGAKINPIVPEDAALILREVGA